MSAWSTIRTVIGEMFETVNLTANNRFEETPTGTELSTLPSTVFNGAYSIALNGIPQVEREVGTTIVALIRVRVQVGFLVNQIARIDPDTDAMDNSKTEYNNAANDILLIIKTMMLGQYPTVEVTRFTGASALRSLEDVENYFVCDIEFQLGAREE